MPVKTFTMPLIGVFLYAEAKVLDEEIAQDIVQDVFLELVSQVSRVIEHPNPGGWIKLTTKNKIHEYERRIRNNKRMALRRGISETASRKRLERIRKKIKSFLH